MNDHDLLIELKTKLNSIIESINELKDNTAAKIEDHEKRLRFIERYVSGAIGIFAIAEVLIKIYFH